MVQETWFRIHTGKWHLTKKRRKNTTDNFNYENTACGLVWQQSCGTKYLLNMYWDLDGDDANDDVCKTCLKISRKGK